MPQVQSGPPVPDPVVVPAVELAKSLSLLDATLESTMDGILVVDREGALTKFNRKFVEMWRIPSDILASRDDRKALESALSQLKDPDGFLAKVRELYAAPEAESFDVLEFKDGRIFERYSKPQKLGTECVGRVWSFRDVTQRRQLEARLQQRQRMESVGTLAGGIAHDLNNILAPIIMSLDLLDLTANAEQRAIIDNMRTSARRGANLVRQVLAFARGIEGRRVDVDLHQVFRELEPLVRETFPRNLRVESRFEQGLWNLTGDPTQLHQVLLNLAVNARDAMPTGGTLIFEGANITSDAALACAHPDAKSKPYVRLRVEDTGAGISPEIRDRIFEPFFTTKGQGKGTGLGLSTVHAIVKSHGGFIEVTSAPGAGSRFDVYLPADPSLKPASPPDSETSPPQGRGESILLVEDEKPVREALRRALSGAGYVVTVACDGTEALALYEQRPGDFALILTDLMMPEMDGVTLMHRIRSANPRAKLVAMTGLHDTDQVTRAAALGLSGFLPKPFDTATLFKTLRSALEGP